MSDPPTARQYISMSTVLTPFVHIATGGELDLAALIAAGQGDIPLIQLPLRCKACGGTGHESKSAAGLYGLAERALYEIDSRRPMRQRIDVANLYADALAAMPETMDGQAPLLRLM
jgi:hypothetical protein